MARDTSGSDRLAARIAQKHSSLDENTVKLTISALVQEIQEDLINGNQSSLDDAVTFRLSLNARLDAPDDPLPPVDEVVRVRAAFSRSFVEDVRRGVHLERLPVSEKLPVITSSEDTVLGLDDVLNPDGALRLTGSDLVFTQGAANEGCVLEGTRSGRTVQSRFVSISDTEITLLPDIPAQPDPWNNEYTLSLSTRYTEHGTVRTCTYRRRLRSPLLIEGLSPETGAGILTGSASSPYVRVTDAVMSGDTRLRIEVLQDLTEERLLFTLLDMREGGAAGEEVVVKANGEYTLPGFTGSAVAQLMITVDSYTALWDMIRNHYSGRLVDVLDLKAGG